MKKHQALFAPILGTLAAAAATQSPCNLQWQPGNASPGAAGITKAMRWDPDGNGPRSEVIVAIGLFSLPSIGAQNIAMFDLAAGSWQPFPESPDGVVRCVDVLPDNRLIVAGSFAAIGAQPYGAIATFDGTSWSPVGSGLPNPSHAIAISMVRGMPNGDIVAGGNFTAIGSQNIGGLARWDGSTWNALGAFAGNVLCSTLRPNGNLVVGGRFDGIGQPGSANVAEWDGSTWSHYSSGVGGPHSSVDALACMPNGDIVVGGVFNVASGVAVDKLARWDGVDWHAMGANYQATPRAMLPLPNGELLVSTFTTINSVGVFGIGRWNGTSWSIEAPLIGDPNTITALANGELLVAGNLATGFNQQLPGVAIWNGTNWRPLTGGTDHEVRRLLTLPNGDVIASGSFGVLEGTRLRVPSVWNGSSWTALPQPNATTILTAFQISAAGTLWGTDTYNRNPHRWTGAGWLPLNTPISGIDAWTVAPDGTLIVAAGTTVLRWTGSVWLTLGSSFDETVTLLRVLGNGDLIAAGAFANNGTTATPRIARWNGTAWQAMGTGFDGRVHALAELQGGDIVAGGEFHADGALSQPLDLVARWNGTSWQALGTGLGGNSQSHAKALHVTPNGDLIVGGEFQTAGGSPAANLARWDGSQWHDLGGVDGPVLTIAQRLDGELMIGGNFGSAGGEVSAHLARLRTDCPASATPYGTPCLASSGPLSLAADNRPWVGSTFRSTCHGAAATALGFELIGVAATQQLLSSLHPLGGMGCELSVQPIVTNLRPLSGGAFAMSLSIPNNPALAGVALRQQALVVETDASLSITLIASSNALALQIGAF